MLPHRCRNPHVFSHIHVLNVGHISYTLRNTASARTKINELASKAVWDDDIGDYIGADSDIDLYGFKRPTVREGKREKREMEGGREGGTEGRGGERETERQRQRPRDRETEIESTNYVAVEQFIQNTTNLSTVLSVCRRKSSRREAMPVTSSHSRLGTCRSQTFEQRNPFTVRFGTALLLHCPKLVCASNDNIQRANIFTNLLGFAFSFCSTVHRSRTTGVPLFQISKIRYVPND